MLSGADDYDLGIKREQSLKMFRGQVYRVLRSPVAVNTLWTDDQPTRVDSATDKDPARTIAEDQMTAIAICCGELHIGKITDGQATNKDPCRTIMNLVRTITLVIVIAFAGITKAEEALSPLVASPAGPRAEVAEDWSQTYLFPEPALRAQIERTRLFLDTQVEGLNGELSRLRTEGLLDRRSASKIRSALEHIRGSISRMAEAIEANKKIDGRAARMVSYELGMAADTLAQQVNKIDTDPDNHDNAVKGVSLETAQLRYPARTLSECSKLVKETAHAIVRHLK